MTNKEILQADMLDILFEHRNKLYGAYALRKTYSRRLGLALGIALSIGLLFILMSFIKKKDNGDPGRNRGDVVLIPLVLSDEKPKEPEPLRVKPKPPVANVDYQPPLIVPDDKVIEPLPDLNAIENANVSDKNSPGDKPDDIANTNTVSEGTGDAIVKEPEKKDEPPLPSHGPSFPGGPAAWLKFLQRILQSPEDIEPGKRVEVLIRFWVDIDGSVSRPEIIRSGGEAFDKEVLRVMKKMPKWDPAVQAGKPIAVAYQQPVIFIGEEQ
jgi:protein TonB